MADKTLGCRFEAKRKERERGFVCWCLQGSFKVQMGHRVWLGLYIFFRRFPDNYVCFEEELLGDYFEVMKPDRV